MTKSELVEQIRVKKSFLCVGLDPDLDKIPEFLLAYEDPIFEFNKSIIEATHDICVAYKPNVAFYEQYGSKGWDSLKKTIEVIPKDCFIIADAKRGDIGNTSKAYARAFFNHLNCDAVTVAPYMGFDSVTPFLEFKNKWVILLALTSNSGAYDFQVYAENNKPLYHKVIQKSCEWGDSNNLMFVVGATKAEELGTIRQLVPEHFLLVPGVGAQGGNLEEVFMYGSNEECGLLINSSRGILYAGNGTDFKEKARQEALKMQSEMKIYLERLQRF